MEALPDDLALVVASDHGNLEDLCMRNHTRAPVPVLGVGPAARQIERMRDLTDLAPLLMELAGPPRQREARGGWEENGATEAL